MQIYQNIRLNFQAVQVHGESGLLLKRTDMLQDFSMIPIWERPEMVTRTEHVTAVPTPDILRI